MQSRKSVYEEFIEWLDTHHGEAPRELKIRNGKKLSVKDMTSEEIEERELFKRWPRSFEYKALMECIGIQLDELPQQYAKYREQIATLRNYGYGIGFDGSPNYKQFIEWLKMHNGQKPRVSIYKNGKELLNKEMTDEERKEVNLCQRWHNTPEYKALRACEGIPLDELPQPYAKYREQIETLRGYGYRLNKKTVYEQTIEWLETHEGRMPRNAIVKNGKHLLRKEMTQEEGEEVNLNHRWQNTIEYKAFRDCKGIPLDKLPPEYEQYKEQIATLRRYEEMRKDNELKRRMQRSVGKQVLNNNKVRQEISEASRELDATMQESEVLDGK